MTEGTERKRQQYLTPLTDNGAGEKEAGEGNAENTRCEKTKEREKMKGKINLARKRVKKGDGYNSKTGD